MTQTEEFCDYFFSSFFWITGILSFFGNGLLAVLILRRSPSSLSEYRVLLMNMAFGDALLGLCCFLVQPRFDSLLLQGQDGGLRLCLLIRGAWTNQTPRFARGLHRGRDASSRPHPNLPLLPALVRLQVGHFKVVTSDRYYVLVKGHPRVQTLITLCVAIFVITCFQHVSFSGKYFKIPFAMSEADPDYIRSYLHAHKPEYNLTGKVIFGSDAEL